jgi:hypothetical protein
LSWWSASPPGRSFPPGQKSSALRRGS